MDERSLKDGAGPEAIVVGVACGRMIMVTATEKQGFNSVTICSVIMDWMPHLKLTPGERE